MLRLATSTQGRPAQGFRGGRCLDDTGMEQPLLALAQPRHYPPAHPLTPSKLFCVAPSSSFPFQPPNSTNPLLTLPSHVLLRVFSFLSHKQLLILSRLSPTIKRFMDDPVNGVWSHLFINDRDVDNYFNFSHFKGTGSAIHTCIRHIVLDKHACLNFGDGPAFSNAVLFNAFIFSSALYPPRYIKTLLLCLLLRAYCITIITYYPCIAILKVHILAIWLSIHIALFLHYAINLRSWCIDRMDGTALCAAEKSGVRVVWVHAKQYFVRFGYRYACALGVLVE